MPKKPASTTAKPSKTASSKLASAGLAKTKQKPSPVPKQKTPTPKATSGKAPSQPADSDINPVGSRSFREATAEATTYKNEPGRLHQLATQASRKTASPLRDFTETWSDLSAMIRLIRAYAAGEYRDLRWGNLATIIGAIIYFVSPIDLVPDYIPFLGYLDDAFVVGIALKSVRRSLDAFLTWENGRAARGA